MHVIQITIDGLRGDRLSDLVGSSPGDFPNFTRLLTEGAFTFNARADFSSTQTIPNHGSMLTGRPVSQPAGQANDVHHGYTRNSPGADHTIHANGNPNVDYVSSTFDVAHDRGLSTSLFVSKERLRIYARSWDAVNGLPDVVGVDNGRAKIDRSVIMNQDADGLVTEFLQDMQTDPYGYSFVHIVDPDSAGHSNGFSSPEYDMAVADVDAYLGRLFDLIDNQSELLNQTAIVLAGDHGGGVPSRSHTDPTAIEHYQVPMAVWGPGVPGGVDLYDLFSNRFDPGLGRPDYDSEESPLWNGDSANIALSLLGLPPIPGSTLIPVPEPSSSILAVIGLMTTGLFFGPRRPAGLRASPLLAVGGSLRLTGEPHSSPLRLIKGTFLTMYNSTARMPPCLTPETQAPYGVSSPDKLHALCERSA